MADITIDPMILTGAPTSNEVQFRTPVELLADGEGGFVSDIVTYRPSKIPLSPDVVVGGKLSFTIKENDPERVISVTEDEKIKEVKTESSQSDDDIQFDLGVGIRTKYSLNKLTSADAAGLSDSSKLRRLYIGGYAEGTFSGKPWEKGPRIGAGGSYSFSNIVFGGKGKEVVASNTDNTVLIEDMKSPDVHEGSGFLIIGAVRFGYKYEVWSSSTNTNGGLTDTEKANFSDSPFVYGVNKMSGEIPIGGRTNSHAVFLTVDVAQLWRDSKVKKMTAVEAEQKVE